MCRKGTVMGDWKEAADKIEAYYAETEQLEKQGQYIFSIVRKERVRAIIARHAPTAKYKALVTAVEETLFEHNNSFGSASKRMRSINNLKSALADVQKVRSR